MALLQQCRPPDRIILMYPMALPAVHSRGADVQYQRAMLMYLSQAKLKRANLNKERKLSRKQQSVDPT